MNGGLSFPAAQQRLRTARAIADAGGGMKEVAEAWCVGRSTAHSWLRQADPALHQRLTRERKGGPPGYPDAEVLRRLRLIADGLAAGDTRTKISHALGYTHHSGVTQFIKRFAPDGLEAAIAAREASQADRRVA
jgi:transposase